MYEIVNPKLCPLLECVLAIVLVLHLALISWMDIRTRRIPNGLVCALVIWGLPYAILSAYGQGTGMVVALQVSAGGALAGVASTLAPLLAWRVFLRVRSNTGKMRSVMSCDTGAEHSGAENACAAKNEPLLLGGGDIKLFGALGVCLGFAVIDVLLLSCAAALVINVVRNRRVFAFGPYIALAAAIVLLGQW